MLLAWDNVSWSSKEVWSGDFSLSVSLQKVVDKSEWLFSGVYGPFTTAEKGLFWEELVKVRERCSHPWCIGGDFNKIKEVGERLGCNRVNNNMKGFSDFIAVNELVDLPLGGASFTWVRGQSRSRLDRFLISGKWLEFVPEVFQKALPHMVSDHCPILLDPRMESWGPSPFRFEIAWLESLQMEERLGGGGLLVIR
ncbi:uncharacterized protein LOC143891029 [Tasmannia lanceolata]|uniref:uncharacterized protein LOC143891029 n=1 Tax=Tasmannia lanceolata TaxID=3420 RepID=UPI0040628A76